MHLNLHMVVFLNLSFVQFSGAYSLPGLAFLLLKGATIAGLDQHRSLPSWDFDDFCIGNKDRERWDFDDPQKHETLNFGWFLGRLVRISGVINTAVIYNDLVFKSFFFLGGYLAVQFWKELCLCLSGVLLGFIRKPLQGGILHGVREWPIRAFFVRGDGPNNLMNRRHLDFTYAQWFSFTHNYIYIHLRIYMRNICATYGVYWYTFLFKYLTASFYDCFIMFCFLNKMHSIY